MASLTLHIDIGIAGDDGTFGVMVNGEYTPFLFPRGGARGKEPIKFEAWEQVAGPVDDITCHLCLAILLPKPMKRKVGSDEGPELPLHPRCRHYWEPIIEDMEPNKETFEDYMDRLKRPPANLMNAVGPVRKEMIKNSDIEPGDLYDLGGPVPRLRTIRELQSRKKRKVK